MDEIELCKKVIKDWPDKVELYKQGKTVFGFFMGQVIKEAEGNIDRKRAEKILWSLLEAELDP